MKVKNEQAETSSSNKSPGPHRLKRLFSFPVVLGALLVAGVFVQVRNKLPDSKAWWQIAAGEHILATKALPKSSVYRASTHAEVRNAYEWESKVVMATAARLAGLRGLTALLIRFSTVFTVFLYYLAYLRSRSALAAFASCTLILPFLGRSLTLNPSLFGYVCLAATLIVLERFRGGIQKRVWILPFIFAVWVNLSGTVALGLLAVGIYGLCGPKGTIDVEGEALWRKDQRRHLLVVTLLCVLALAFTPYGPRLAVYPFEALARRPFESAGLPTNFHGLAPAGPVLVLCLILWAGLAAGLLRAGLSPFADLASIVIAFAIASLQFRALPLILLVMTPWIAVRFANWLPDFETSTQHYVWNAILIAATLIGILVSFPSAPTLAKAENERYPEQAISYLAQYPRSEPILDTSAWGGYVAWKLNSGQKLSSVPWPGVYDFSTVFQDLPGLIRNHTTTRFVLQEYGFRTCVLTSRDPLSTVLATLPDWRRVYEDNLSVIFVRQGLKQPEARAPKPASD